MLKFYFIFLSGVSTTASASASSSSSTTTQASSSSIQASSGGFVCSTALDISFALKHLAAGLLKVI